jgi:hypothetical protein
MLDLVPQDPVQAADGAIRYLLSFQRPDETVYEFLMRLAEIERHNMPPIMPRPPEPAPEPADNWEGIQDRVVTRAKPRKVAPALAPNETRHWPPIKGQRYVGEWPPRGLVTPIPRDPPGVTLPLDAGQQKWLERYSEKYPGSNPWQQITLKEAKAREQRALLSATFE